MMLPIAVLAPTPTGGDDPVGAATLVNADLILTCVHVLRVAGYPRQEGVEVRLRFSEKSGVVHANLLKFPWLEPGLEWPPDENLPPRQDVVALRLTEALTGQVPEPRSLAHSDAGTEMSAVGFPGDAPAGREAHFRVASIEDARGLRQLNWRLGEVPVDLGFSGGSVWDQNGKTVGMIVSRWRPEDSDHHSPPLGFMVPLTTLSELLNQHDLAGLSVKPAVFRYSGVENLIEWVERRLKENPYHQTRKTRLLPTVFAVGDPDQTQPEIFTAIERLHSGDDEALARFKQRTPSEICAGDVSGLYVQAPGGAGKSYAVYDLVIASVACGRVPILINAVEGAASIADALAKSGVEEQLEALFTVCKSRVGFRSFRRATRNQDPILLVIDGLNEASTDVDKIIDLAANTVANFDSVQVVIVDRMTLRRDYADSFKLATVAPLDPKSVQGVMPEFLNYESDFQRLLRIPFFLDLFRESGDAKPGKRTRILLEYVSLLLKDHLGSHEKAKAALGAFAEIAFEAYRSGGQNLAPEVFKRELLSFKLDPQRLADSGLLRKSAGGSHYVFRHQLMHDYFASRHFITEQMAADAGNLNVLTLSRRSWDPLVLALEDSEPAGADKLLVDIYDWDPGATLSCLVETRNDPNDALATAICAVLSEKLEDPFLHTRLRSQQKIWALKRFLRTEGELSLAQTLEQIRSEKERFAASPLQEWWLAFTADSLTCALWQALVGTDALAGWSAAAAFRRILLQAGVADKAVLERLTILYDALRNQAKAKEPGPIRWRIVHVLGRFQGAIDQLMKIGFDANENDDIHYGAFRELIEIASTSSAEEGARILTAIADRIQTESLTPRALSALRSCAILKQRKSEEPVWWEDTYKPLFEQAMALARKIDPEYAIWEAQKGSFEADERQKSF